MPVVVPVVMNYKITSGRKRESPVWSYFQYDAVLDKSKCITSENGSVCGILLAGKNSTNLITHLRTSHKAAYADFVKQQEQSSVAKKEKPENSEKGYQEKPGGSKSGSSGSSLKNFLKGAKPSVWPDDSKEKLMRDEALCKMIVMCGLPARLVEHPSFREFCNILDPKFVVPGE